MIGRRRSSALGSGQARASQRGRVRRGIEPRRELVLVLEWRNALLLERVDDEDLRESGAIEQDADIVKLMLSEQLKDMVQPMIK